MTEFDESKLEKSGWRLFVDELKQWYRYEFMDLPLKWKFDTIDYVIDHNARIFQREDVLSENLCNKCGRCCEEIGCPDWDPKTKLCTIHDNQNSKICEDYPWDDDIGMVFTLNCAYQRVYVRKYLDRLFTKAREMGVGNGETSNR